MTTTDAQLIAELRDLRDRVVGVTDVLVASADGLLITAETDRAVDAEALAALTAAALGVARRTGALAGRGLLDHASARFTGGCLTAHAIGETALIGVLGDAGTDLGRLNTEARASAERIGGLLTGAPAAPVVPAPPAHPTTTHAPAPEGAR
ncbi:roadblock/LC7 domain-containing protein [Kitasatospora cinereorecta]|uniref:Roadblock/LC7 domain-containing protein n=1 Tax=Kitasatospora cinereorecta TaxID=285560 RepID=A0ABW0VIV7_9ACTN